MIILTQAQSPNGLKIAIDPAAIQTITEKSICCEIGLASGSTVDVNEKFEDIMNQIPQK